MLLLRGMLGNTPQQKRYWQLSAAGVSLLVLLLGFVAGFFTAKHVGTESLTRCYSGKAGEAAPSDTTQTIPFTRGMPVDGLALRQLPPPWSEEAEEMRSMPDSGTWSGLYTYYSDAEQITEQLTRAFLEQLQAQLDASGQNTTNRADLNEIIAEITEVARDVLNYLRHHNSQALLPMLRQYAQQGSFTVADIDPDVMQQEVRDLLDLDQLGQWYARVARKDHPGFATRPVVGLQDKQGITEMLQGSTVRPTDSGNHRHLLTGPHQSVSLQNGASARHLHAAPAVPAAAPAKTPAAAAAAVPSTQTSAAGTPIPIIPAGEAVTENVPATVSPLMTLQDMLCNVQQFSPTKLKGLLLPSRGNSTGQRTPIKCEPLPEPAVFRYQQLVFKPVKIPVVFHCQRFRQGDMEMPPLWRAEEAAANLIKVANTAFERALIQFELQEVRYDSKKYPYLLLGSLKDWQECTGNPSQEDAGFPCLAETAQYPEVASLVKKHVINVIVGGSGASPIFCNSTSDDVCGSLYAGYTGSIGPWFMRPSTSWSENVAAENWIFLTWDEFSPMVRNSKRFWDGGGVTFAHELGHYLGLMHTHEGAAPCEGDGVGKADAVPDTPVNEQTIQWASQNGLAVQLSRWCTQFRGGKQPDPKELLVFNSCQQDSLTIDNVFNLLSYLPDQCCMLITANQIARLQWAIAKFRPKMMAAYAVK